MPHLWVQLIKGTLQIGSESLQTGDGLAVENNSDALEITATEDSEFIAFRLA